MKPPRLAIFDWLRVLAIGLVVGDHILNQIVLFHPSGQLSFLIQAGGFPPFITINLGSIGVIIFLILSGMVLEYNYGQITISYFSFIYKRLKRIYLVYWISLFLAFFLLLGAGWPQTLKGLFYNLSGLLLYTGRPWTDYFIPTAFFIGLIFYLYLFFPLLSKLIKKKPILTLIILLLVSAVARYAMAKTGLWFRGADGFPLCRIFEFGLGIWLAQCESVKAFCQKIEISLKNRLIFYLSELSFPALLVHSVVLKMNLFTASWLSIVKFLEITLVFSIFVHLVNIWALNLFKSKRIGP